MVRVVVKIVIALVVLHAAFRIGTAYWTFYRFEDALQQLAQFGERRTDKQLCEESITTAATYRVPIDADAIVVRRGTNPPYSCGGGPVAPMPPESKVPNGQLAIDAAYVDQIQVLPGYNYQWEFKPAVRAWIRMY
ncbi:MAG TPA: hypothetical protein VGK32_10840 [Vicinamibacterales bacterium]|jgi:hypothetical protein